MAYTPSLNKTVLLLTACVQAGGMAYVRRNDPGIRLEDYKSSLRQWLANPEVPIIVFCENSGYNLAELESICQSSNIHRKEVEFLSFSGQDFPPHRGKGYGEMGILEYALQHSRFLADRRFIKTTGRLYISNMGQIIERIDQQSNVDVFCDLRRGLTFADSRVFSGSASFLRDYLIPLRDLIDDSKGVFFEHVLARAVHRALSDGRIWAMLPCTPDIRGTAGTSDVLYSSSRWSRTRRELFRRMKISVLAR